MAINDKFSTLSISRQRRWQLRQKSKGLCIVCTQKAEPDSSRCAKHTRRKKKKQEKQETQSKQENQSKQEKRKQKNSTKGT